MSEANSKVAAQPQSRQRPGILIPILILLLALLDIAPPVRAELALSRVWPEKIYCHPGEMVDLEVQVSNPGPDAASAKLVIELRHDVDSVVPLASQDVALDPGKTFDWKGSWKAEPVLGVELAASLQREGKGFAQKREFFTCARSVHQVLLCGHGNHGGWQFSGTLDPITYPDMFAGQVRSTYGNFVEKFGWAPSDFDDLTPRGEGWWAGQTGYNESKPNMIAVIEAMHRQGIQVVTYGKAAAGGPVGYDILRMHPERASYTDGRPWLENYDAAYLDFLNTIGPPKPGEKRMIPGTPAEMEKAGYSGAGWFTPYTKGGQTWCSIWYSCAVPNVADTGIHELAGSAKLFGFDGVRFDGEFFASRAQKLDGASNVPPSFDPVAANLNLVRVMKTQCRAAKPGYVFGYNTGTDIQWSVPAGNTPPDFQEKCREDGLIANEGLAFPGDVPWLEYAERVRRESDLVRHYGGHHATYPFNRNGDRLYNYILNYALRSHSMTAYTGGGVDINRFATRFAALLWDDRLHGWEPGSSIKVTADRELWWKPFAAVRPVPGGGTQFLLHLVNPPEGKTVLSPQKMPAAPARNVDVRWSGLAGFRRAWIVDLDSAEALTIESEPAGADRLFRIPEIPHWAILVVEKAGPVPPMQWDLPPGAPAVRTPSSEDLQLTPKPGDAKGWRSVIEPETWGGGEATADRVKDPDALNGGAVHGKPGRPPGLMAYTYGYPRIPGKYRAIFRLKVADNTVDKPIFSLNIDDWVSHPLPGVPKLSNPTRILKATDFKAPGVYQDFEVPFEHSDVGFLGVNCSYLGAVESWWDRVTLELVEPWTADRLIQHYAGFRSPPGLAPTPHDGVNVLVVRGLWNRLYRVDEAAARLPGTVTVSSAYTTYHPQHDTRLSGFDLNWQPLYSQDVVVLANVETRGLGLGQVRMLEQWVKDGGRLVILGGLMTLGQSFNMERGWPDFLPVELNMPWEIRACTPPVTFAPPRPGTPLAGVTWERPPALFFRHVVRARPSATILLSGNNGEPLLVGQSFGKGSVTVFTGTALGDPPTGSLAFWGSPAWPEILAKAMEWKVG